MLARLSELIFVETIRQHLETLPPAQTGWLAGLRDPFVGRALAALHGAPRAAWTVERLARLVGVSRSVFADRFTRDGRPAADAVPRALADAAGVAAAARRPAVAAVAGEVGYESEAAFSRAFKKLVGDAPAVWRAAHGA